MSADVRAPGTIVPYERFLEARQRRRNVVAAPTPHPGTLPEGDPGDGEPVAIESEAPILGPGGPPIGTAVLRQKI
jgi:hypothetical protein